MNPVWLVVRAALRQRWRAWLVVAVVAGLLGGLVMAVAAGARRTDAAYPALVAWSRSPDDVISTVPGLPRTYANVSEAAVRRLPQVTEASELDSFTALVPASITVMASTQGIPGSMWRRKMLAGSLPAPGDPNEVDVSFATAQSLRLSVGGTLATVLLGARGQRVPVDFRVAGIDAAPGEFPPQYGTGILLVWATPAFTRQMGGRLLDLPGVALRLRHGSADVPALESEISRMAGGKAVSDYPLAVQAANTEHSIHLQAVALWLLGGLLALPGLLILSQLLSRLTVLESAEFGVLRSFGMGPAQLTAAGLVRAALIGAVGAALALVVAVAASPVFPVGMAAIAEPHPGVNADWLVLGLGMVGVVVVVTGCAAWPAWRASSAPSRWSLSRCGGSPFWPPRHWRSLSRSRPCPGLPPADPGPPRRCTPSKHLSLPGPRRSSQTSHVGAALDQPPRTARFQQGMLRPGRHPGRPRPVDVPGVGRAWHSGLNSVSNELDRLNTCAAPATQAQHAVVHQEDRMVHQGLWIGNG